MIDTPLWLWMLLPIAALAGVIARRGRRASALVRGSILALLVVALAGPRAEGPRLGPVHVLVVDRSDSIRRLSPTELSNWTEGLPADAWVAVVSFGRGAQLTVPPVPRDDLPTPDAWPESDLPTDASHLGEALQLAARTIPATRSGGVHLLTDGHATAPFDDALQRLAERGLSLDTLPIVSSSDQPGALQSWTLPERVSAGATAEAAVQVWGGTSGFKQDVVVQIPSESGPIELARQHVEARPRTSTTATLSVPFPPDLAAGVQKVTASAGGDHLPQGIVIERAADVLVVYGDRRDGAHLSKVLEADGLRVTRVPAGAASLTPPPDLVVLAGPSAGAMPADFLASLPAFVEDGGGLLTLAGPDGYAAGRWQDSSLAGILPVRIDPDGAEKDDTAALLVVLDKSGSMARPAEDAKSASGMVAGVAAVMLGGRAEGSKIRVAAEAAAATMTKLRDHDRFGVLAVDTLPYWALQMSPAAEREKGSAKVRQISAGGGGMYVLTALEAAAKAMRAEEAPLRHILILVDASDAGEQDRDNYGDVRGAVETARALRAEGITLSVVGIGSTESRDSPFLRKLAQSGGGRLKLTPSIRDVSALFTQEVERLVGSAVSEAAPVRLVVAGWHPALRGVDMARAPTIWGWSETRPRAGARHVLTTPEGAPVLSVWRRGLGQVASLTTDDGARWARGWPRWSDSAALYTQLARDLARDRAGEQDALTLRPAPTGLSIEVQHRDEQKIPMATDQSRLSLTVDGVETAAPALMLSGVGRQSGQVDAPMGSRVEVTLTSAEGDPIASVTGIAPTPAEHGHRGIASDILAGLRLEAGPVRPARGPGRPMWPLFLTLALLLLPLDAWSRRRQT